MSDVNREARKSPEQLEREINERRAHLTETLSQLEQRLSPGQMFDQVLEYGRANGGEFGRNLLDTVKNNPVPALLTVLGISWMAVSQNRPHTRYIQRPYYGDRHSAEFGYAGDYDEPSSASYGVDPAYDPAYSDSLRDSSLAGSVGYESEGYWDGQPAEGSGKLGDKAEHLREKAADLKDQAGQRWNDAKQRLGQQRHGAQQRLHSARQHAGESWQHSAEAMRRRADWAREGLSHQAQRAGEGFDYLLREQPLALGAVGIAIGALVGALLPPTRREDQLLGSQRDQIASQALAATRQTYETAKETGARVAEQAKRDLQRDSNVGKPH